MFAYSGLKFSELYILDGNLEKREKSFIFC